jgi:acetyl esterase/lipase
MKALTFPAFGAALWLLAVGFVIGQDRQAEKAPRLPEGVKKVADLDYAGTGNARQRLDLYLPVRPASAGALPVIVFVHGGGWQNGDKSGGRGRVVSYVATGRYAAVSIGYRLSSEAVWPAQIHDCKAAIRWLRAHAAEYRLDPERIAVWGTSAGGHLAAMLGVSQGVEGLEGEVGPHRDQSSRVRCVVDFFGPAEMLTMGDHPSSIDHHSPQSPESRLIGGAVLEHPDRARSASPIEHVSRDDAPHLIVHGTADKLVPYPQSVAFEKRLEAAGVPAILLTVEGGGHGQGFGKSVGAVVEAYFAKHLLGGESGEIADRTIPAGG